MNWILSVLTLSLLAYSQLELASPLTFATEATYPPFESMNTHGHIVGFDADLVLALCKTMHQHCQLVNAPFASLIPSLNIGQYDAIIGGLAITPSREKVIAFSQPYYQDQVVFVSRHILNLNKLHSITVGVQMGTAYQAFLQQFYQNTPLKLYNSNLTALMDLKAGRVGAVLIDQPVYAAWLNQQSSPPPLVTTIAATTAAQKSALSAMGNGIGIAKHNTGLLKKINHALSVLKQNGSLQQLQQKWFSNVNTKSHS